MPSLLCFNTVVNDLVKFDKLCTYGATEQALDFMEQRNVCVSKSNAYFLLQRCIRSKNIECGRRVQSLMLGSKLESAAHLGDYFIRLFSCIECISLANQAFNRVLQPSVYTWTAIISAHISLGHADVALSLYQQLKTWGIENDSHLYLVALKACILTSDCNHGKLIHGQLLQFKPESNIFIGSSLVDMYAKCGCVGEAQNVFDNLLHRDVVLWNTMIAGYALHEEDQLAIECLDKMQQEGIRPTIVTFSTILKCCGRIGAIDQGRCIDKRIFQSKIPVDVIVRNSLVDMYAKCGSMDEANNIFNKLPTRDVVSWNSMLDGYARIGYAPLVLQFFEDMQCNGVRPNNITFISILSVCNRVGLVEEGISYLKNMKSMHHILPDISHTNCTVDLLGHAGHFGEAKVLLQAVPEANICGWRSLLNACLMHGNVELGTECFNTIVHLDYGCHSGYVLISNMYANALH